MSNTWLAGQIWPAIGCVVGPQGYLRDSEGPTPAAPGPTMPIQLAVMTRQRPHQLPNGKQTPDVSCDGIEFDPPVLGNVIQEEDRKNKHRGCWIMKNDDPWE